jgi:hypothetical protein
MITKTLFMKTNPSVISKSQNSIFKILLLLVVLLSISCSSHIYVSYQPQSANTSSVVLKPSRATVKTNVTIDDNLIVNRKNAKDVTIKNVPAGMHTINYTSESGYYKEKLDAQIEVNSNGDGKTITKLVVVPPYSTGYWIYMSVSILLSFIIVGAISY